MRKVLKGNEAVAHGVRLARARVVSAYPITPQTSIIETLAAMVAAGDLDARFVKVESEHSALAACIAAETAGVRTFTATSAQGLALMHELLHWASGARLPIVLADVNRAMAPGWSIWTDQTDSLSQRDTGWMQVYCASAQEVLDSVIQAYRVAEQTLLPAMVVLDAFFLSHTAEEVDLPEQALVDAYLPELDLPHRLEPGKPAALGNLVFPDRYMEFRRKIQVAHEEALAAWIDADAAWHAATGRGYGLVEPYRLDDAEIVLVAAATMASTARIAVDALRRNGVAAGLLRLRLVRPVPTDAIRRALAGRRRVVVVDRNCSLGCHGIFHQEIKSALFDLPATQRPAVHGIVAGLGGRDIRPDDLEEMMTLAAGDRLENESTWWDVLPDRPPLAALTP
jgi:pyruvate/2-oxoacid:ferredoxin oxidoreductase alpha subunit